MKKVTDINDPRYVKAFSHPLRVRIMGVLERRTASPRQIADVLGVKIGVVAYHVRTLERLGLIELIDETRVRGAVEHHYRSRGRPRVTDEAWAQASPITKQAAVGSALQMIHEYANASAAAGGFDHGDAHLSRTSMRLDRAGREQLAAACTRLMEEAGRIGEESAARLKRNPHSEETFDAGLVLLMFEAVPLGTPRQDSEEAARGRRRARPRSTV